MTNSLIILGTLQSLQYVYINQCQIYRPTHIHVRTLIQVKVYQIKYKNHCVDLYSKQLELQVFVVNDIVWANFNLGY